jgi:DNA (cytosine-5)-methyltransferase 1
VVGLGASYFVFENVRGLAVGAHRKFIEEIIGEFRKNAYRVREDYRVLNAAHHGVPQNRQRLFLMGARKGFPLPEYPEATHEVNGDTITGSLFLRSTPTVWDALRDLPEADDFEELPRRDWVQARFKKSTDYALPCMAMRTIRKTTPNRANSMQACLRPACTRSIPICRRSAFSKHGTAKPNP